METITMLSEERNGINTKQISTFCLAMLVSMFLLGASTSAGASQLSNVQQEQVGISVAANDVDVKPANNGIYLVRFKDSSLSTYDGSLAGLKATSPKITGALKIDAENDNVKAYQSHLTQQRANFSRDLKRKLKRDPQTVFDYRHVLNGVALKLSQEEAKRIAAMNDVASVTPDTLHVLHTDSGPRFIGAEQIWDGTSTFNGIGTRGEGVIIGIIDSGVNSDHPSFAAVGGDGYAHTNPFGSGIYTGRCGLSTGNTNYFGGCNDKLVGAHDFVDAVATQEGNDGPEDENGHGSHTASTSGGNYVDTTFNAPTINLNLQISGVAPHANIIACDACYTNSSGQGLCPGSATAACVDALIADGVDAINYSISGGVNPWSDSVSQGFLDATAAGIYVAASAGNSGPAAGTVAHQEPWVSTTAASSHDNNSRANSLIDMSGGNFPLDDLNGLGITSAYGPSAIIYAGDTPNPNNPGGDPAQCLQPYPSGTFNGEIVVCDRGAISRVQKGQNVLSGGAGGFVLANTAAEGEGTVADPHELPGVHIGFAAGQELRSWLASGSNHVASISGTMPTSNPALGDIMAGFSSRGPGSIGNMMKPDITAPGSSIYAAVADSDGPPPQFGTLSGTSMSSPHNAGSGALMRGLFPTWTPYEIKSAIMMTASTVGVRKEDGVTPSDPFDRGAGRIDLTRAALTGLVMDETVSNMQSANPNTGGDPGTLNIASMQSDACAGSCQWTRTFTSVASTTITWETGATGDYSIQTTPSSFTLAPGASQTVNVVANTFGAQDQAWNFGQLTLTDSSSTHPTLSLPVVIFASTSTNPALITKTVNNPAVDAGDEVTYTINVNNIASDQDFTVTDVLPSGASYVNGSASQSITGGTTSSAWAYNSGANQLSWSGNLNGVGLGIAPSASPAGYMSLADQGVTPAGCPSNCDDGAFTVSGFNFTYLGQEYTDGIWSVNGTLELGTASGAAASASNQNFPSNSAPNNLLAAFWTDMNLDDGGNWYSATLTVDGADYFVLSWENVPRFSDPTTYSFQIWLENNSSNFWFVYDRIPAIPASLTVGFEDAGANIGVNYFYNGNGTAPVVGTDLLGQGSAGGSALFTFDAVLNGADGELITNTVGVEGNTIGGTAIAVAEIVIGSVDSDGDGWVDSADNCILVANADQRDTNGDGYGNICDPDLNNDGVVNFLDIPLFSAVFGTPNNGDADFNGDGFVNFLDYSIVPTFFLNPPGPSGTVP